MIVAFPFPIPAPTPTVAPFQFQTRLAEGLFRLADLDRSGGTSKNELQTLSNYIGQNLAYSRYYMPNNSFLSGLRNMFQASADNFDLLDTNHNGEISYSNSYAFYGYTLGQSEVAVAARAADENMNSYPGFYSPYGYSGGYSGYNYNPDGFFSNKDIEALRAAQVAPPPIPVVDPVQPDLIALLQQFLGQPT